MTKGLIERFGPTAGCPKCTTGRGAHSADCRLRIEEAVAAESRETRAIPAPEAARPATVGRATTAAPVGPGVAMGSAAPAVPERPQPDAELREWGRLAAELRGKKTAASKPGGDDAMGEEATDDSPAKRGRVGGFAVNMIGGVECGFDGWDAISTERVSIVGGDPDDEDLEPDLPEPGGDK